MEYAASITGPIRLGMAVAAFRLIGARGVDAMNASTGGSIGFSQERS